MGVAWVVALVQLKEHSETLLFLLSNRDRTRQHSRGESIRTILLLIRRRGYRGQQQLEKHHNPSREER